jgi:hypothetical protein
MAGYTVTAPLVTARTENGRIVYLYFGDVVPSGLAQDSVDHLRDLGFIKGGSEPAATILPAPAVDEVAAPVAQLEKPAGNAGLDEWTVYARSQGATDDDLEGLSRNDVRDLYK